MINQEKLDEFMNEVKKIEKGHKLDLSSDEDLSIGIMNLISIEEHLFFTANKTGKTSYYDLLYQIREIRKTLLKEIIKDYEGEVWCISKHLLAASMRVMEVGTKALATEPAHAHQLFEQSYYLYNLFWALNLKLIDEGSSEHLSEEQKKSMLQEIAAEQAVNDAAIAKQNTSPLTKVNQQTSNNASSSVSSDLATTSTDQSTVWKKLGQTLNKMLDCCRE